MIPRIGASITFYAPAVLRQFEMMNTAGPQQLGGHQSHSRDKLRAIQLLSATA